MQLLVVRGYDGGIATGQREIFVFSGTGPTSYSNIASSSGTGDILNAPFGLYIDAPSICMTKSSNFVLIPFPSAVGTTRATWSFKWFQVSNFAEVANGTNLSGESVQFSAMAGNF